jgi:hypothetical protein
MLGPGFVGRLGHERDASEGWVYTTYVEEFDSLSIFGECGNDTISWIEILGDAPYQLEYPVFSGKGGLRYVGFISEYYVICINGQASSYNIDACRVGATGGGEYPLCNVQVGESFDQCNGVDEVNINNCDDVYITLIDDVVDVTFENSSWFCGSDDWHAPPDEICDYCIAVSGWGCNPSVNQVEIRSWMYDGKTYSYEGGPPYRDGGSAFSRCTEPDPDKHELYVRFQVPYSHYIANIDIIDVDVEFGSSSGTYDVTLDACYSSSEEQWQALLDVSDWSLGDFVYWRVSSTICDSTKVSPEYSYRLPHRGPYLCGVPTWYDCD